MTNAREPWTIEQATDLYMIDRWGGRYFGISADGKMTVSPLQERGKSVAIIDVVREAITTEGLKTPLVIRFQDILHHRVRVLNEAFARAIEEIKYRATYRGVFPIKVNQLREVVEEILDAGRPFHYGIEVGSKPEMYAGLAIHRDNDSLIVCNGYKDDAYIRAALLGRKLGKKSHSHRRKTLGSSSNRSNCGGNRRRAGYWYSCSFGNARRGKVGGVGRGSRKVRPVDA